MEYSTPIPNSENATSIPHEGIGDKVQRDLSVGTAWLVVLATIARSESPVHGYEIARSLGRANPHGAAGPGGIGGGVKHGTLYPILRTMEAEGLVTSTLVPSTQGPARRCFTITPTGRATLDQWSASWRATKGFVDGLFGENP